MGSKEEERYTRQTSLQEVGHLGQKALNKARVAIVGCGGLGSIVAPYLAGAGIGHISLIDGDQPHISNLHRQVFFHKEQKQSKAYHLSDHIKSLNPNTGVTIISEMLSKSNIDQALNDADLIVECTDDMMTKYLVNDWCHLHQKTLVYGAIYKFEGYVSVFPNKNKHSIHLRDIFPEPDIDIPTCSEIGVLGTTAGIIGLLQANEVLKVILGLKHLSETLLTYDCIRNEQFKLKLKKNYSLEMVEIFQHTNYSALSCLNVPEIEIQEVLDQRERFQLISILEEDEHAVIDDQVIHTPLSHFNVDKWIKTESNVRETVFYCRSGQRSAQLVEHILTRSPSSNIYSLKGGILSFKDGH